MAVPEKSILSKQNGSSKNSPMAGMLHVTVTVEEEDISLYPSRFFWLV